MKEREKEKEKVIHRPVFISLTWELVRHAKPQAPPDLLNQKLHFTQIPRGF